MKCSQARRLFSAYLDQDLTFEEESRLRAHLESCTDCTEEMARLEGVQSLLQGLPETDPGPGFYESIRRRVAAGEAAEPVPDGRSWVDQVRELWSTAWLRPAAGAAFGLVVGVLIGTNGFLGPGPAITGEVESFAEAPAEPTVDLMASGGPLADIELPAISDSVALDDGDEFILEPYATDGQGNLAPYRRTVNNEKNGQARPYITF